MNIHKLFIGGVAVLSLWIVVVTIFSFVLFSEERHQPQETIVVQINGIDFFLEVADSPMEREQGLQGRTTLPTRHGVLFIFPTPDLYALWMKNTLVPLDFVWIQGNTIVDLTLQVPIPDPGTPDDELIRYTPSLPVDRVIELPAGDVEQYGIAIGQSIEF